MLSEKAAVYPVRIVLRRTGLTAELLRAWERRYGVVAPARTKGGQRLYSESDVARLALLRRATLAGHSIGRIAELSVPEIETLLESAPAPAPAVAPGAPSVELADAIRLQCLEAIEWMDGSGLDGALRRAALAMGPLPFAERIVVPLVREVGDLWHEGKIRIVQEHLASNTIRSVLSGMLSFAPAAEGAPVFLAGTTSGQHHELGAMLAAAVATTRGWRTIYLGPDLPGEEIGLAAARLKATAIGLSLVYPLRDGALDRDLGAMAEAVGRTASVYVGGEAAEPNRATIEGHGFELIGSLGDLAERLTMS